MRNNSQRINERSVRVVAAAAFVAGLVALVALLPTGSSRRAEAEAPASPSEVAYASGTDIVPLVYPSVVNVRLVRAEAALERATTWVDQRQGKKAIVELQAVRANMAKAWSAAQYVIRTTPPPVAEEGSVAHASGDLPVGLAYASPQDTALAVLNLQHDVVSTSLGILTSKSRPLTSAVSTTIHTALVGRDAAIAYIHSITPPPVADEGRVQATASDEPVVADWATVMPNLLPLLDDEVQQMKATARPPTLAPAYLPNLTKRAVRVKGTINLYWPPLPPED
jgi:hypothetical protein